MTIINKGAKTVVFMTNKFYSNIKIIAVWIMLLSSDTLAQLLLKTGADKTVNSSMKINLYIIAGYSALVLSFTAWMQILKYTRLSIAEALTSLLYITVAFASFIIMKEPLTPSLIIGTILITAGVFIIGFSEGTREEQEKNTEKS